MAGRDEFEPHAFETQFDPDNDPNCGLLKENVQEVIEELCGIISDQEQVATPGFTWGASGAIKNSYLQNDTVPSNKAGRLVTLTGSISAIFIVTELDTDEYTLEIKRRNANGTYTTILSLVGNGTSRTYSASSSVVVSQGDELAAYLKKSGNKGATNPVCGIIIKGA